MNLSEFYASRPPFLLPFVLATLGFTTTTSMEEGTSNLEIELNGLRWEVLDTSFLSFVSISLKESLTKPSDEEPSSTREKISLHNHRRSTSFEGELSLVGGVGLSPGLPAISPW